MQKTVLRMAGLVAVGILLQSCGGPKSSSTSGPDGGPVATSKMNVRYTVEAKDEDTAVARVNLNDGKILGKSYRLDGGDFLRACSMGACRNLADNNSILDPDYIASFLYRPGVDYVVSFNRQEAHDAPDSRVSLPPAFTIVTPANHQQVTDGETVLVSWSPTGAPADVALSYDADCTRSGGGSHTIATGTLSTDANADGSEPISIDHIIEFVGSGSTVPITRCSINVTVSHQLYGRVDPAFRSGIAVGIVSRRVNLDYVPR